MNVSVVRWANNQHLQLDLHNIINMFMWHLREYLLGGWQIFIRVNGPSKKHVSEIQLNHKTLKGRELENKQLRVIKFEYSIVSNRREKCRCQHASPY